VLELVSAGLTPADALRSATIDAARFSHKESDFGSIEAGKVADMILLAADPLTDIRNSRQIDRRTVFQRTVFRQGGAGSTACFCRATGKQHSNQPSPAMGRREQPEIRVQLAD
jgi:cytosine/adenosine deaminase-related metal-dependent hydrolase